MKEECTFGACIDGSLKALLLKSRMVALEEIEMVFLLFKEAIWILGLRSSI
jgi:hypothetical protein